MGEGGGKDRRQAVVWNVAILREEKDIIIGGIKVGRYGKIPCADLARAFVLNRSLTSITRQEENIRGNDETLPTTLVLTEEEAENIMVKFGWSCWDHWGWMQSFLVCQWSMTRITQLFQRRDVIWLAVQLPTRLLLQLRLKCIKVSVSTLRWDSQRPADSPLPTRDPPPFFLEESKVNMANVVVMMQSLKACVTCYVVMDMDNSMQKGPPDTKIFKNDSVSTRWCQAWFSRMIAKVILKSCSGTVPHDVTREAWWDSSNLEASYSLHDSEPVKYGIPKYTTSYDKTVEVLEETIVTHSSHIICYKNMHFQITQTSNVVHTYRHTNTNTVT